ncbi:MAG: hypothetical protein RXQ70_01340 [Sulfolobaceae archaeon]|nr:hypothetical protein [Sulfolobales archaeon]
MNHLIERYLSDPPKERITFLRLEVPCDAECLQATEFADVLKIAGVQESLEAITYLKMLIEEKANELVREVRAKLNDESVELEKVAYSIYWSRKEGNKFVLGSALTYGNLVLSSGSFKRNYELLKKIEAILKDENVRSLCDEIDVLTESLWTHFDKNVRRVLNEAEDRNRELHG